MAGHTEVQKGETVALEQEDVSRMWIRVEETVPENHVAQRPAPDSRDHRGIAPLLGIGGEVIYGNSVYPFQGDNPARAVCRE
ncbi:MAG: hypothetical protein BWX80_02600 [Candidatus Hydrogenedentes bacterium ADurb.Bin101]|nr:MAG: hypothetical protein BWX80_02600 [Candidatus Hydrogenedentes bacterium ADurb.Bin101]